MANVGLLLLGAGTLALLGYGAFFFVRDFVLTAEIPLVIRIASVVTIIGLVITLLAVGRERLAAKREETFRDVQR